MDAGQVQRVPVCLSVDPREAEGRANTIMMHPGFRMIVLANRPGFPFLGNDFFGALGTNPSTHMLFHTITFRRMIRGTAG